MQEHTNIKGRQGGFTLIESLLALVILAIVVIAFVSGLGTGAKASLIANEQATAESLARSQIELIKNANYSATYAALQPPPTWSISTNVGVAPNSTIDALQEVNVSISHSGKQVLSVSAYKGNR
ncbi:MAG: type II secretion system protein [Dehalococcoidales bacterium]|nr:type II secretion system protein [Dehalococcoidales bacterium]